MSNEPYGESYMQPAYMVMSFSEKKIKSKH